MSEIALPEVFREIPALIPEAGEPDDFYFRELQFLYAQYLH